MKKVNRLFLSFLLIFSVTAVYAQRDSTGNKKVNSKRYYRYLEDQLYVGFTYNLLINKPDGVKATSLPNTFSAGYIRDLPLNKRRNIGLAAGIGVSFSTYYQNMKMTPEGDVWNWQVAEGSNYKVNKFAFQTLDIPIQLRFRTSSLQKMNFWRFYLGFTPSWMYTVNTTYKKDGQARERYYNPPFFNNRLFYANFLVGYSGFSLKIDYSINSLFRDDTPYEALNVRPPHTLNIGILYYIL